MRVLRNAVVGVVAGGGLLLGGVGCQAEEDAFIMSLMHKVVASSSEEVPAGKSCANIIEGNGSSGLGQATDDFWFREETSPDGVSLKIGSFDAVLVDRFYDRAFIANHAVDRFVVTTQSGDQYAYVYWGGDTCESCPPSPFESLPGDPWGCGSVASEGESDGPSSESQGLPPAVR